MQISIANFLQMVTDRANIAIANKYQVAYGLSIVIFAFDLGPLSFFKVNISQMLTGQKLLSSTNRVTYWLSNTGFKFDLGLLSTWQLERCDANYVDLLVLS